MIVSSRGGVESVLADPRFVVPEAPPAPPGTRGMAWFRAAVPRFANGAVHERRRRLVEETVARLDPADLAAAAHARTVAVLERHRGRRLDVMAALARRVPVTVLYAELGRPGVGEADLDDAVDAVAAVAAAYPPGGDAGRDAAADAALGLLLAYLGGYDETGAARLCVLVQACDATAGLVGNTLHRAFALPPAVRAACPVGALVEETLRHTPPVRVTRRRAACPLDLDGVPLDAGTDVVLDLAAANRDRSVVAHSDRFDPSRPHPPHLTFGHGPRACPGDRQARAIAGAVVAAVLDRCAPPGPGADSSAEPEFEPSPNLAVPVRLEVIVR